MGGTKVGSAGYGVCVCVCVRACVRACVSACVCARARVVDGIIIHNTVPCRLIISMR